MAPRVAQRGCALITGGSGGIGAAVARGLAADGWAVAISYRSRAEAARAVAEQIGEAGGKATLLQADVSERGAAEELCGRAEQRFELPLLVLVNNAAVIADHPVVMLDDESWQAVLETNLSAAFRLTRRALPRMVSERFGRVVNVASVVGPRANPGQAAYAASKAGLVGFTKTVAVEVARHGVTANAIAPGLIETEATEDVRGAMLPRIPARRVGEPAEVAACARFLVSEAAAYVTGSVLTVDGGLSA